MKSTLDDVVRAGAVIGKGFDIKQFIASLVEQLFDITGSHLVCFYSHGDKNSRLLYRRGRYSVPGLFSADEEPFQFILESGESVVLTERKKSPFLGLLLHDSMNSGVAVSVGTAKKIYGFIVLNSELGLFFTRSRLQAIEAVTKLAGEFFHNSMMHNQLKEYTRKIEILERYQERIFSSMTTLLLAVDSAGNLKYFNRSAGACFFLTADDIGKNIRTIFNKKIGKRMLSVITSSVNTGNEVVGAEGIYRNGDNEIDFSLNTSPLYTSKRKRDGLTLLFTDQSRERELEKEVNKVKEERRLIKDIFSRYLSDRVVAKLVENPDLIHLGGDKKEATIFFADIRGYTSFSEGKDPEYIINILNEYFSVAVEIIIEHSGYIDKFIGDAIMAAWGVPLKTEEEDAQLAVSCALEIQKMVKSSKRAFFKNEASDLKIGIGIHTGPLVAGNLGSARRVDYTVIGDTVNIAARLEGIAGPDEIIITGDTRSLLPKTYKVEKRPSVKVKGKKEPINIFNVIKKVG
jgi:class 3 adenylate cyclase